MSVPSRHTKVPRHRASSKTEISNENLVDEKPSLRTHRGGRENLRIPKRAKFTGAKFLATLCLSCAVTGKDTSHRRLSTQIIAHSAHKPLPRHVVRMIKPINADSGMVKFDLLPKNSTPKNLMVRASKDKQVPQGSASPAGGAPDPNGSGNNDPHKPPEDHKHTPDPSRKTSSESSDTPAKIFALEHGQAAAKRAMYLRNLQTLQKCRRNIRSVREQQDFRDTIKREKLEKERKRKERCQVRKEFRAKYKPESTIHFSNGSKCVVKSLDRKKTDKWYILVLRFMMHGKNDAAFFKDVTKRGTTNKNTVTVEMTNKNVAAMLKMIVEKDDWTRFSGRKNHPKQRQTFSKSTRSTRTKSFEHPRASEKTKLAGPNTSYTKTAGRTKIEFEAPAKIDLTNVFGKKREQSFIPIRHGREKVVYEAPAPRSAVPKAYEPTRSSPTKSRYQYQSPLEGHRICQAA